MILISSVSRTLILSIREPRGTCLYFLIYIVLAQGPMVSKGVLFSAFLSEEIQILSDNSVDIN